MTTMSSGVVSLWFGSCAMTTAIGMCGMYCAIMPQSSVTCRFVSSMAIRYAFAMVSSWKHCGVCTARRVFRCGIFWMILLLLTCTTVSVV